MEKYISVFAAGKAIGGVRGDTFYKSIRGSRHFLKRPPAIALDCQSITDARAAGAVWAEVADTETGKVYRAKLDTIERHGHVFNYGFGEQIFLKFSSWGQDDEPAQLPLLAEVEA